MKELTTIRQRVQSIDILRGLVMVIMALDHVRDFLHNAETTDVGVPGDPTNLATTTPFLFFTRWITHFCAPIFVFLSGASVYLMCLRKSKKEVSLFLIKRGFWLLFVEIVIITFGWTFNPFFNVIILQVIWAIGISMILFGVVVLLPYQLIFAIGFIIVAGHNLLDYSSISSGLKGGFFADLLYFSNFSVYALDRGHSVLIIYAFLPWMGVMLLGYCFGKLYSHNFDASKRKKFLLVIGGGVSCLFIVLRVINSYGDPVSWTTQARGNIYTVLSFFNLNKYPPSLLFLCMTLGPGILFLTLIEKVQNGFTRIMNIYGRVPMFYYILHFYLIHIIVVIVFYAQGFGSKDILPTGGLPFYFKPNGIGFGLLGVYGVWLLVVLLLYPLCKKYDRYKTAHAKEKWWLSYI